LARRAARLFLRRRALAHRSRRLSLGLGAVARVLRGFLLLLPAAIGQRRRLLLGFFARARFGQRLRLGALALGHHARSLPLRLGARVRDAAQLAFGDLALAREVERAPLLAAARHHRLFRDALGGDARAQILDLLAHLRLAAALGLLHLVEQLAHAILTLRARGRPCAC